MINTTVLVIAAFAISFPAWAQQKSATPQEVVDKTRQAVRFLEKEGEAGLRTFNARHSPYVWADSYVFVADCKQGKIVAHPILTALIGKPLADLKDPSGKVIGPMFCESDLSKGYWIEYQWPKPGETKPSRKLTYVEPVPNTPYRVGAGVYDDRISLTELEQLSR